MSAAELCLFSIMLSINFDSLLLILFMFLSFNKTNKDFIGFLSVLSTSIDGGFMSRFKHFHFSSVYPPTINSNKIIIMEMKMNKNHERIFRVIDSIHTAENSSLVESIKAAAQICFEYGQLPTRDLGYQPMTAAMPMQINLGRAGAHKMGQGAIGEDAEELDDGDDNDDIDFIQDAPESDEPKQIEDQSEIGQLIAALKSVQDDGGVEDVVDALQKALEIMGGEYNAEKGEGWDEDDLENGPEIDEECMGY